MRHSSTFRSEVEEINNKAGKSLRGEVTRRFTPVSCRSPETEERRRRRRRKNGGLRRSEGAEERDFFFFHGGLGCAHGRDSQQRGGVCWGVKECECREWKRKNLRDDSSSLIMCFMFFVVCPSFLTDTHKVTQSPNWSSQLIRIPLFRAEFKCSQKC